MGNFLDATALFLQTAVQMGTPLLFATLGGILSEKAGNMNLGIEGMMLMGAVIGFKTALTFQNAIIAMIFAGVAGAVGALIYGFITITLKGNQVVTGLTLTIFGTGIANFIGKAFSGVSLPAAVTDTWKIIDIPVLKDIPILGKALFSQSIYVHIGLIMAVVIYIYLNKTRVGLNLRGVGENPGAADASGVNVSLYKYLNVLAGGFLCGIGGAYFSLVFVPRWQENITAGNGWIAVALIIFSTWNPLKAILGSYLFGALRGVGLKLQNVNWILMGHKVTFSAQLLDTIPYIMTILVLVFISFSKKPENQPPLSLGNAYFREDR